MRICHITIIFSSAEPAGNKTIFETAEEFHSENNRSLFEYFWGFWNNGFYFIK